MAYRRASHTAWRRVDGQMAVVDLARNTIFGLSELGGIVWDALGDGVEVEVVAAALGGGDRASGEALSLLEQLRARGLVEGGGPPPSPVPVDPAAVRWQEELPRIMGASCLFGFGNDGCGAATTT